MHVEDFSNGNIGKGKILLEIKGKCGDMRVLFHKIGVGTETAIKIFSFT